RGEGDADCEYAARRRSRRLRRSDVLRRRGDILWEGSAARRRGGDQREARDDMSERNATAAIIGAGDYIGAAIAKKFAAEGFTVSAGRRNGDKLAPLGDEIKANGGTMHGRSLDARKDDEVIRFLADADACAPLEVCIFNIGANVNFPILE